jgi:hypothetical protein
MRVVDAAGTEVGAYVYPNSAVRQIGSVWVELQLATPTTGVGAGQTTLSNCSTATTAGCIYFLFETDDCSGPVYVGAWSLLVQPAVIVDDVVHFPDGSVQERMVRAYRADSPAAACSPYAGTYVTGALGMMPASSLGLIAPFSIER